MLLIIVVILVLVWKILIVMVMVIVTCSVCRYWSMGPFEAAVTFAMNA